MKKMILAVMMIAALGTGCKKKTSSPASSFKIGSASYTALTVTATNTGHWAIAAGDGTSSHAFAVYFNTTAAPTAGSYNVKTLASTSANDCFILVADGGTAYNSTGTDNKTLTVSVSGGKVRIVCPSVDLGGTTGECDMTQTN